MNAQQSKTQAEIKDEVSTFFKHYKIAIAERRKRFYNTLEEKRELDKKLKELWKEEHLLTQETKNEMFRIFTKLAELIGDAKYSITFFKNVISNRQKFFYLPPGNPHFPAGTTMEKLLRHQMDPPPAIQALRPDVRPEIAAILTRLLAKKPDDRFQSGAALVEALQPFLPIPTSSTSTSSTRLVPKPIVASGGSAPAPVSGGSPTASGGYAVP
ncbi:MAG: hypothetical protein QW594_03520, partial [Candidatus Woesearchaeota archaeon]